MLSVYLVHVTHLHRQLHWERACIQLDRHTEPPRPHPHTHGYSPHCSVSSFSLQGTKYSTADAERPSILSNQYYYQAVEIHHWLTAGYGFIATIWAVNLPVAQLSSRHAHSLRTTSTVLPTHIWKEIESGAPSSIFRMINQFLPQSSSSELSRQSFTPLQCSSLGMQMSFLQLQSDSKQPSEGGQWSSSEPVGHCICPSQRADVSTQPTVSTQENWPGGHSDKPAATKTRALIYLQFPFPLQNCRHICNM